MKKISLLIITIILLILAIATLALAEPTEAELTAFQSAMAKYQQSMGGGVPLDPSATQPTPEQLKNDAIVAFQGFITTYPQSELCDAAQNYIGWCYFELNNLPQPGRLR